MASSAEDESCFRKMEKRRRNIYYLRHHNDPRERDSFGRKESPEHEECYIQNLGS